MKMIIQQVYVNQKEYIRAKSIEQSYMFRHFSGGFIYIPLEQLDDLNKIAKLHGVNVELEK